jgi:hypothetical protein
VFQATLVIVARPQAEVLRYVADLRNEPRLRVDVASVSPETDPLPVVGKSYTLEFKPSLGQTDGTFTALEVEPDVRVVYRADFAGLQPRITYTLESAGEGPRFTRTVEMRTRGLKVLIAPVMAFMVPRRNKGLCSRISNARSSPESC